MLLRAIRAAYALQARCAELEIVDTQLRCKLYDAVVKPVLPYGCAVWVPLVSDSSLDEHERVHRTFLRRILDVPCATAAEQLYAETGRLPHKAFWWQQSLKYMHSLTLVEPSHFVHKAFTADHMQELGWRQAVHAHLSPMGVIVPTPGADFNPEAGCAAMAAAAETVLMAPTWTIIWTTYTIAARLSSGWSHILHSYTVAPRAPPEHASD